MQRSNIGFLSVNTFARYGTVTLSRILVFWLMLTVSYIYITLLAVVFLLFFLVKKFVALLTQLFPHADYSYQVI